MKAVREWYHQENCARGSRTLSIGTTTADPRLSTTVGRYLLPFDKKEKIPVVGHFGYWPVAFGVRRQRRQFGFRLSRSHERMFLSNCQLRREPKRRRCRRTPNLREWVDH